MDLDMLCSCELFAGMSPEEITGLLEALSARERSFIKGEYILRAGETTQEMGLVLSGSVLVENNDIWGNRTILNLFGPGEFFGEVYALLPGEPLLVDVCANRESRILMLCLPDLEQQNGNPSFARLLSNLLLICAGRNLMLSGRAFHISPKTIRGRIMAYLNSISLKKHARAFEIPFDRQQMADYLNVERTALSKELGKMKKDGLIDFAHHYFEIL